MAGTANISSTFAIQFYPSNSAATTITNPGRTFKVVGVSANNTTGGALTVTVTDGAGNAITQGAESIAANSSEWAELTATGANLEIAANENIIVTAQAVGLSPILLHCVASGGGEALTAT